MLPSWNQSSFILYAEIYPITAKTSSESGQIRYLAPSHSANVKLEQAFRKKSLNNKENTMTSRNKKYTHYMTCIDSRLLPLPSPHVWMNQWGRRCGCRRAGRGCSSFRKIYVCISLCAVQDVVYVDCLAPPCIFIQSGSQIACRLLKQWNKAQAGVTADTRHGSLPSADVTFKTKPVSSLTYGRIVLASRTIACCHCATAVMTVQILWHCGESNSAGSFLSTQLLFSLPAMRLWGWAVHQQITQ